MSLMEVAGTGKAAAICLVAGTAVGAAVAVTSAGSGVGVSPGASAQPANSRLAASRINVNGLSLGFMPLAPYPATSDNPRVGRPVYCLRST